MKSFHRICAIILTIHGILILCINLCVQNENLTGNDRPYRVEINRLAREMEQHGAAAADLSGCHYVTHIEKYNDTSFFTSDSDYVIREIRGILYRFDYQKEVRTDQRRLSLPLNLMLAALSLLTLSLLLWIRQKLLIPFTRLSDIPVDLARGNLTIPLQETKSHFFGRFIWGINLLRENIEEQKQRELALQKEKKTLLLSLSHDIKTPLSAIKLYAKALSRGLYDDPQQQIQISEHINEKADEIQNFISQIVRASRSDFMDFQVKQEEFYLSGLLDGIAVYYKERLSLIRQELVIRKYSDCLLKGDAGRSAEVLQNIIENAVKYGDGKLLELSVQPDEDCILISVSNSGCQLMPDELPHIFESFWQGSNASTSNGSGLGLYICRQLMHRMDGEIFAEIKDHCIIVTAVFSQA